ncbi:MAG: hypothetical protein RSC76_06975 [Oscillospiraceae bacterium]
MMRRIAALFMLFLLVTAIGGCRAVSKKPMESISEGTISKAEKHYQFRKEKMMKEHYRKHVIERGEFGDITIEEYLQQAQALISSTDQEILTKTEGDGDTVFYRESTNEYAVLSKDGYIRTYFKPTRGIDYFNR